MIICFWEFLTRDCKCLISVCIDILGVYNYINTPSFPLVEKINYKRISWASISLIIILWVCKDTKLFSFSKSNVIKLEIILNKKESRVVFVTYYKIWKKIVLFIHGIYRFKEITISSNIFFPSQRLEWLW